MTSIRVFTDGACSSNGRPNAKGAYAAWFPDHPSWSSAVRLSETEPQTNQRSELRGILHAVTILEDKGELDSSIIIYSDSDYSIKCLTVWLSGWMRRGWKTAESKDVLHQDLIKDITQRLSKFKSHRFVHVKAHTGGTDDLSVGNHMVDRMAQGMVEGKEVKPEIPVVTDEIFAGCPLRIMGPPCQQKEIVAWMKGHMDSMDKDVIEKHLFKAFTELCKIREISLTKQTIQKQPVIRAEKGLKIEVPEPTNS